MAFIGLFVKGQGRISNSLETFPIYIHISNFKGLRAIVFEVKHAEENLCGGGVTGLNPKYPRLCLGIQLCSIERPTILITSKTSWLHRAKLHFCWLQDKTLWVILWEFIWGDLKRVSLCVWLLLSEGGQQGQQGLPKVNGPYGFLSAIGNRATAYFCPWYYDTA